MEIEKFEKFEKKNIPIHWMIVAILTVVLVLQTIVFFIYSNYDGIDNSTLKKEYVKINEVSFDMLNNDAKVKYVQKDEFNTLEERYGSLKEENLQLLKKLDEKTKQEQSLLNTKTEVKEVKKDEAIKEDIKKGDDKFRVLEKENYNLKVENAKLTKEIKTLKSPSSSQANNKSKKPTFNTDDTNYYEVNGLKQVGFISCKDMNSGAYNITKECRDSVEAYLKTMPQDGIYEVVAMLGKDDKKVLNSDLAVIGLGKYRVAEAKWLLTKALGENVKIKLVSYDANTNDSRGFVIKVYK